MGEKQFTLVRWKSFFFDSGEFSSVVMKNIVAAGVLGGIVSVFLSYVIYMKLVFAYGFEKRILDISLLMILYAVLIAPFLEEYIFRKRMLQSFSFIFKSLFLGVLASNLFWCLMHFSNGIHHIISLFIPGLIFSYLTIKFGSFLPSSIAHLVHNAILYFGAYQSLDDHPYFEFLHSMLK